MKNTIELPFPRGDCPLHTFGPVQQRSAPIVLLFMDAFSPRPTLFTIAERLAQSGYRVVMPDLFYEFRPYEPIVPSSVFSTGADRPRLMKMLNSLDQAKLDADISALLEWCKSESDAGVPMGATGYCMGGRYALTAATLSPRVVMAAAFHASNLAPDEADSVHHRFAGVKAHLYIGVAQNDPTVDGAEQGRLAAALRDADTVHTIETYPGAMHGYAMEDLPAYNAAAAARHWSRLSNGLSEAFARA